MSNSTPPGWYPVPGADGTPGHERWWDGGAWTDEVRPLRGGVAGGLADAATQTWQQPSDQRPGYGYPGGSPAPTYGYPGQDGYQPQGGYQGQSDYPAQGGYPPQNPGYGPTGYGPAGYYPPPAKRRTGTGMIVGIAVAVLAVGGIAAGIVLNSGGDRRADPAPGPTVTVTQSSSPTPSPSPTVPRPSPTVPKPAPVVKTTVPDPQHAIIVPVFEGWETSTELQHSTLYLGTGRYTCPTGGTCIRGQFSIEKDTVQGTSSRAAAEAAMPAYAVGIFSGISSHTDAGSGYVKVAGVLGYATRWHVRTSDGTQGYVLLAALPAKGGGFVVMEGGVDDSPSAPDFSVLDQLLNGITQDSSSGSST
ncbi:DUF2510 domain-containing protein [Kitasatospora sp. NPDC056651]|uniref:DUF2510 domain-containing protein n=1 Tax=Kitasatospora sp. NPDC056651 TaxID=3345892 RepID=UPI00368ED89A